MFPCVRTPSRVELTAPVMSILNLSFVPGSPLSSTSTVKVTLLPLMVASPVNITLLSARRVNPVILSETRSMSCSLSLYFSRPLGRSSTLI